MSDTYRRTATGRNRIWSTADRRQLALVHELAQDTNRHGRRPARPRISSTYELAGRVCGRLGLSQWEEIGPYAIEHGLMDGLDGDSR